MPCFGAGEAFTRRVFVEPAIAGVPGTVATSMAPTYGLAGHVAQGLGPYWLPGARCASGSFIRSIRPSKAKHEQHPDGDTILRSWCVQIPTVNCLASTSGLIIAMCSHNLSSNSTQPGLHA